ncbi:MAG: sigma-70 family RNA polymerase sigma factor [Roseburia sp.]|nr:sigma-70 family RNA polymerase sigma factor [Roseburia sp.]
MDDRQIIELYHERSEAAISETADKYGRFCHYIAVNILHNEQDSEECVNDTWLRAWNAMPPQRPNKLSAFLGKITRNLALDKYKFYSREKRGGGQVAFALEELAECVPAPNNTEQAVTDKMLVSILNEFLATLPAEKRKIFVRRYWYLSPVVEIAKDFSLSESNVKIILHRTRAKLKHVLEKEGIFL